ncbi:hypothetical protein MAPG_01968 [Magnaporthiopsis poae ATCC 64411]|uniref:Uncharacterized protein n=1 Tax=Magnaporthiopsis poae (strain ATCC 64411 / 73-15) TaxID=644358 RepID=A0A0C4DQ31_MAGP6|nr:hypothetical protein MAPG_01968 [Magnaporthiopsis poae ATCC 64411]
MGMMIDRELRTATVIATSAPGRLQLRISTAAGDAVVVTLQTTVTAPAPTVTTTPHAQKVPILLWAQVAYQNQLAGNTFLLHLHRQGS